MKPAGGIRPQLPNVLQALVLTSRATRAGRRVDGTRRRRSSDAAFALLPNLIAATRILHTDVARAGIVVPDVARERLAASVVGLTDGARRTLVIGPQVIVAVVHMSAPSVVIALVTGIDRARAGTVRCAVALRRRSVLTSSQRVLLIGVRANAAKRKNVRCAQPGNDCDREPQPLRATQRAGNTPIKRKYPSIMPSHRSPV